MKTLSHISIYYIINFNKKTVTSACIEINHNYLSPGDVSLFYEYGLGLLLIVDNKINEP